MSHKINGISLIVLVITIIIIIILAGAVILSLNNSNIIAKAKLAKESNDFTGIREAVDMEKSNEILTDEFDKTKITIPDSYTNDIFISNIGGIFLLPNASSKITDVGNALNILGAAYLPTGFTHVEGTLEEGIVIKNTTDNNEFVWIPVKDITQFYLVGNFTTFEAQTDLQYKSYNSSYTEEKTEYDAMYESVKKYKGFYIARYEAGKVGTSAASKPNIPVYNNIGLDSATTKARLMYTSTGATTGKAISTIIYGEQWDAAMRYMKDVPNKSDATKKYITYSAEMGNYNGTGVLTGGTGSNSAYNAKNIYDMAGNVWEWTMEAYGTSNRAIRGGSYSSGTSRPASYRFNYNPFEVYDNYGFRVALYIK